EKVTMQAMLVFACMNLKKLANWLWRLGKTGRHALNFCLLFAHRRQKKLPRLRWHRGSLSAVWSIVFFS
ncbi:MAG TPA: hypothetical protein VIK75_05130, partial [Calditerricola sp.]